MAAQFCAMPVAGQPLNPWSTDVVMTMQAQANTIMTLVEIEIIEARRRTTELFARIGEGTGAGPV